MYTRVILGMLVMDAPFSLSTLDDAIILCETPKYNLKHFHEVLSLLGEDVVSLKLNKCELFDPRVNYLGILSLLISLPWQLMRLRGLRSPSYRRKIL